MAFSQVALITGACGGIGRPCARHFGRSHALFLTDVDALRLDAFAETLREEGYTVAGATHGDLADPGVAESVVHAARAAGPLSALVHTAGLSPALADWRQILNANVVATERLLLAVEAGLDKGFVAVLIASMAGHLARPDAELDRLCTAPLARDFLEKARPRLEALSMPGMPHEPASTAYTQSKRAVLRTCAARCGEWGAKGARIVSVSPGTIWTPMGRKEVQDNPAAAMTRGMAPIQRWGTPMDIADAVAFLASDRASFITGTDLRVDGGVTPVVQAAMVGAGFA